MISASNNATRSGAFPKNPGRQPYTIMVEGWYTFEHRFRDNGFGVLAVDLTIKNSLGVPLMMWTLSDPSDIIATTVGGNRYGWFVINEFPFLAFENSALVGFQDYCVLPTSTPGQRSQGEAGSQCPAARRLRADRAGQEQCDSKRQPDVSGPYAESNRQEHCDHIGGRDESVRSDTGHGEVNGAGSFGFEVQACDNGEPGKDTDTFSITMSDAYSAAGTLGGGNIQIH